MNRPESTSTRHSLKPAGRLSRRIRVLFLTGLITLACAATSSVGLSRADDNLNFLMGNDSARDGLASPQSKRTLLETCQTGSPSIVIDKRNATVTCLSPKRVTMATLADACDAVGYEHGFYKYNQFLSVNDALATNDKNIKDRILALKVNVLSNPRREAVLGAKTHEFNSGLKTFSLFCGLDGRFELGDVSEVTFTLRDKAIHYPDFHLITVKDATRNKRKIIEILRKIKIYLCGRFLPLGFERNPFKRRQPKMALFKRALEIEKSKIDFEVFPQVKESEEYSKDSSVSTPSPNAELVVTFPRNTEEVAAVVKLANRYNIPWVPRGKGTSTTGSPVPMFDSVLIDMSRYMTDIISFRESEDGQSAIVLAEAGAINADVQDYVMERGWRFSPTPGSYSISTIGGNLANDAVGINGAQEGSTGKFLNAASLVTSEGDVLQMRRDQPLEGALLGLLAGSEGRLGVFTEMEFILSRQISEDDMYTLLFKFEDSQSAMKALSSINETGIVPMTMEFMDSTAVEAINYVAENKIEIPYAGTVDPNRYYKDAGSALLVRVTSTKNGTALSRKDQIISAASGTYDGLITAWGDDESEKAGDLLNTRLYLSLIAERYMEDKFSMDKQLDLDPVVPLDRSAEFFSKIKALEFTAAPLFCHAGDMIFHPMLFYSSKDRGSCVRALNTMKAINEAALTLGGQISGEHGIGFKLSYLLEESLDNEARFLQQCVMAAFSSKGLANPGKILSRDSSAGDWLDSVFCRTKLAEYTEVRPRCCRSVR